jgi:microcystin degradation protein MlrC
MRIAIAGLHHETNTFCPERADDISTVTILSGDDVLNVHPKSFVGGFVEGIGDQPDLIPTASIRFSGGGPASREVFEACLDAIATPLRQAGEIDGVYLALHGAMVADEPYTDAEGALARVVREIVGDTVPIVATYDFHAIMSDYEVAQVIPFPNNTNPHIDGYERGLEAADCLQKILTGGIHPVTRILRVPIIGPNIGQSTWAHDPDEEQRLLMYRLNQVRAEIERRPGVINVTLLGGYGYGDSADESMSIIATTDGDPKLADSICAELGEKLWDSREELVTVRPIHAIDDGVRMAMGADAHPVLLVDLGDDPGSACPADSPAVLESLLRLEASDAALTIRDSPAVTACVDAGVGNQITVNIGGSVDDRFYKPLPVTGAVKSIDDGQYAVCGPTHGGWGRDVEGGAFKYADVGQRAVLRVGNRIDIILSHHRTGKDRDFFKSVGILLEEKKILVVKSNQAHRASFDTVVASTIELNTPGVSTVDYEILPFKHLKHPLWPIDRNMTWSPP